MKIQVNGKTVYEISDWEKKLLEYEIHSEKLIEDIERRVVWVITHKLEHLFKRIQDDWMDHLREDPKIPHIPKSKKDFVEMVSKHHKYQDRKSRDENPPLDNKSPT